MQGNDHNYNRSQTYNKRKRKKWKKYVAIFLLTVAITGLSFTGYTYWKINQFLGDVSDSEPIVSGNTETPSTTESPKKDDDKKNEPNVATVLIIGVDYRPVLGSLNTDVMMLASIDADKKNVSLVSIPRDTYIDLDNYWEMKMNAVYAQGEHERKKAEKNGETPTTNGSQLLKQAVGELFNVPIDYYVRVDFEGFTKIIDELGGIRVDVDRNMHYVDNADGTYINLKKGEQVLSGEEALDFVRFRQSSDGHDSNDFERNERQQKVVKASTDKMKSFVGILNFFDVLDAAGDHIRTDMEKSVLKEFALTFRNGANSVSSIETNAYWDSSIGYTRIDREDRERISRILSAERTGEKITEETSEKTSENTSDQSS